MQNMSYVRFENTLQALHECMNALREEGFEELSESEKTACLELAELCKDFPEIKDEDVGDDCE